MEYENIKVIGIYKNKYSICFKTNGYWKIITNTDSYKYAKEFIKFAEKYNIECILIWNK